ncbi:nuclear pore complex protein Nup58 [Culicoides brevitarsis]|uniref:nuclear pore complex protein Nup58 n=1 Tax=Culicoides brevitarsis TaxID=469753 RepID=UPI00307C41C5
MSGFNFGTPQATTTTQNTGFSFSASTPAAPSTGFGGFGGITSTPAAAPAPATGGFSFGLSSSTPAATSSAPSTAPTTGFSFGTPAAASTQTGLTLGTTSQAAPAATGGFNFGQTNAAPATTAPPAFGFGQTTTTTQPQASGLQFGLSTAPKTTAPTLTLGVPAATTSAPGFGFGSAVTSTTSTAPASTGFSFGAATTTSTAASGTTATPGLTFGGGLSGFGTTAAASNAPTLTGFGGNLGVSGVQTTTTVTISKPAGLGGIDINATLQKPVEGKSDSGKVKENQVPVEIVNTVEALKTHIKTQKTMSSDIARTTTRKMLNVQSEIQDMAFNVQELADKVQSNKASVKLLRQETTEVIHHTDMAQRTHDTPVGLQFENTAPLQYFIELTQKYENDLMTLKNQVELTEKHMISLTNPQSFTPEDLKKGLQQLHESFIALAGRLYDSHQKVQAQKEQYLSLRRHLLNDKTDVFNTKSEAEAVDKSFGSLVSAGPTPFSTLGNLSFGKNMSGQSNNTTGVAQQQQQQQQTFGFNQSSAPNTSSGFFNLQNPPFLGQKRNKP